MGDIIRIRQVMLNLLNNAVKVYDERRREARIIVLEFYCEDVLRKREEEEEEERCEDDAEIVIKFTDDGHILVTLGGSAIEGSEDWKFEFTIKVFILFINSKFLSFFSFSLFAILFFFSINCYVGYRLWGAARQPREVVSNVLAS